MLYLVFLVLISVSYITPATIINIDPQKLPFMFKTFMACIDKNGIDSKTMQKIMDWKFDETDSVKKYMFCFANDTGFSDQNGHLVKEKFLELLGNHPLKGELSNAIDECNKLQGNDKYDTIFKNSICYRDTSPVIFKL